MSFPVLFGVQFASAASRALSPFDLQKTLTRKSRSLLLNTRVVCRTDAFLSHQSL